MPLCSCQFRNNAVLATRNSLLKKTRISGGDGLNGSKAKLKVDVSAEFNTKGEIDK